MAGKFLFKKFADIDLSDVFFDSLKADYPEFSQWYQRKASEGRTALVFDDDQGLGAFVCLKEENEPIELGNGVAPLPAVSRIKISTLKLADRYQGQRLGEGAIGLALWKWQKSKTQDIYVTVFDKHTSLIGQLERYGFILAGHNNRGECVYIKSRIGVDYSDPYKAFPFVDPAFRKAGYLIVDDYYHDTLFPYSELKNTLQESVGLTVANGISKIYVGNQFSRPHYQVGEPILIYRRHTKKDGQKPRYKSCLTSFCVVTGVLMVKINGRANMTFDELKSRISNKSVFDEREMQTKYNNDRNLVVIEMLYYGYFGEGNNVNMDWLDRNGFWAMQRQYPTNVQLTPEQFKAILKEGKVDVPNVIIN